MKPGDWFWCSRLPAVEKVKFMHKVESWLLFVDEQAITKYRRPDEIHATEKEALEALIKVATDKHAEQTQQHNDLIARLSRRLEDL